MVGCVPHDHRAVFHLTPPSFCLLIVGAATAGLAHQIRQELPDGIDVELEASKSGSRMRNRSVREASRSVHTQSINVRQWDSTETQAHEESRVKRHEPTREKRMVYYFTT